MRRDHCHKFFKGYIFSELLLLLQKPVTIRGYLVLQHSTPTLPYAWLEDHLGLDMEEADEGLVSLSSAMQTDESPEALDDAKAEHEVRKEFVQISSLCTSPLTTPRQRSTDLSA